MNDLVVWTPEMSVGNQEIDSQHKDLLDTINVVRIALNNNDCIIDALSDILDHSIHHFAYEEAILINSPTFDDHKKQHDLIRENIHMCVLNMMKIDHEVLDKLLDALVNHIVLFDMES